MKPSEKLINDVFEAFKDEISISFSGFVIKTKQDLHFEIGFKDGQITWIGATKNERTKDGHGVYGEILSSKSTKEELDAFLKTNTGKKIRQFVKEQILKHTEEL